MTGVTGVENIVVGAVLAGRGQRLLAQLVDASLSLVPLTLLCVGLSPVVSGMALVLGGEEHEQTALRLLHGTHGAALIAVAVVIGLVLTLWQWTLLATDGVTVGKRLVGIRVVDKEGKRAGFGKAVGRRVWLFYALCMIPFVGLLLGTVDVLPIFFRPRRCLHDYVAGTLVVRTAPRPLTMVGTVLCAAFLTSCLAAIAGAALLHAGASSGA